MKKIFINTFAITLFFFSTNCKGQVAGSIKTLRILDFTDHRSGYVIQAIEITSQDSVYMVSLKGEIPSDIDYIKMLIGNTYNFEIVDIDTVFNGRLPSALPNGYTVRFRNKAIKRDSRNGKTLNTTQFYILNSIGLYLKKNDTIEK